MHLKEVDKNQPYLFVSYSNADRTQVHADVKRLQQAGINIWIDTELDRYTGESWKKVVKYAMMNSSCKAILFFVSKFSLSSDAVKEELDLSRSKMVIGMHKGKELPIIPIRVTVFNSIKNFGYKIANELGDKVCASELTDYNDFKPAENVINILSDFFSDDSVMHTSIYDAESIYNVVKSLKRYGLKVDVEAIQEIENDNARINTLMKHGENCEKRKDIKKAIEYFEEAAFNKSSRAYLKLGKIYAGSAQNMVSDLDCRRAQSCFIRAIDMGLEDAKLDLAILLCQIGETKAAMEYLKEVMKMDIYKKKVVKERCDELMRFLLKKI